MRPNFVVAVDADEVTRALEDYLQSDRDTPDIIGQARMHRALPLMMDWGGCVALRPTGELVSWAWDDPAQVSPVGDAGEHDRRIVHAARARGAGRFPQITGLAPVRDENARRCPTCKGTGKLEGMPENIICACGGLGWISW